MLSSPYLPTAMTLNTKATRDTGTAEGLDVLCIVKVIKVIEFLAHLVSFNGKYLARKRPMTRRGSDVVLTCPAGFISADGQGVDATQVTGALAAIVSDRLESFIVRVVGQVLYSTPRPSGVGGASLL